MVMMAFCQATVEWTTTRPSRSSAKASILAAEAGYDMVAPSDMMDGRILKIRKCLDGQGYAQTGIISYSAKFSSSYYGPFRDAIDSKAEVAVDKSGYQLNPANFREAQRELELDHLEGQTRVDGQTRRTVS